jgi:hypothetical protein
MGILVKSKIRAKESLLAMSLLTVLVRILMMTLTSNTLDLSELARQV